MDAEVPTLESLVCSCGRELLTHDDVTEIAESYWGSLDEKRTYALPYFTLKCNVCGQLFYFQILIDINEKKPLMWGFSIKNEEEAKKIAEMNKKIIDECRKEGISDKARYLGMKKFVLGLSEKKAESK